MAREEHDREDLLAEATALVERVAIQVPGNDAEIVVGFRHDASISFYLTADRVYQFNSDGQLRRAHVGEQRFKAEYGKLVSLTRQPRDDVVELIRHELDPSATAAFLSEVRQHLDALAGSISLGEFTLRGEVPPGGGVIGRVANWLQQFGGEIEIAPSARAR